MQRIPVLAIVTTIVGLLGCFPNPRCDDDVRRRLLDDCKLSFTPPTGIICGPSLESPEAEEARFHVYDERVCRIIDPGGDTDCLRTATCVQIEAGECFEGGSKGPRDEVCVEACEGSAAACYRQCEPREPYEACAACSVDCVERTKNCLDRC